MRRWAIRLSSAVCAVVFLGWLGHVEDRGEVNEYPPRAITSPTTLAAAFDNWARRQNGPPTANTLVLSLTSGRSFTTRQAGASGKALVDLIAGSLTVTASGLDAGSYDVWLIDNTDGDSRGQRLNHESPTHSSVSATPGSELR